MTGMHAISVEWKGDQISKVDLTKAFESQWGMGRNFALYGAVL